METESDKYINGLKAEIEKISDGQIDLSKQEVKEYLASQLSDRFVNVAYVIATGADKHPDDAFTLDDHNRMRIKHAVYITRNLLSRENLAKQLETTFNIEEIASLTYGQMNQRIKSLKNKIKECINHLNGEKMPISEYLERRKELEKTLGSGSEEFKAAIADLNKRAEGNQ